MTNNGATPSTSQLNQISPEMVALIRTLSITATVMLKLLEKPL